jgi:alpha-tubulin suppressor-like RCC1 family protein
LFIIAMDPRPSTPMARFSVLSLALTVLLGGCSGAVEDLGNDNMSADASANEASVNSVTPTCDGGTGCAIAAGQDFACAVTATGGVRCWGDDLFGELGTGKASSSGSSTAVDVVGLDGPIVQVALGDSFACALARSGKVQCWGDDGDGELGSRAVGSCSEDPCTTRATTVTSLPAGVVAIGTGELSAYALANGAIQAWGDNGDGSLANAMGGGSTPVPVMGLRAQVARLTGGLDTGCALTAGGGVMCWGWGEHGQIGNGTMSDAWVATAVTGLTAGVRAIASGGEHTCALLQDRTVQCWGDNSEGELGNGSTNGSAVPVQVTDLSNVQSIAAGEFDTCALLEPGGVKCWGGILNVRTPTDVPGLSTDVVAIAVGADQVCAQLTSGGVKCLSVGSSQAADVPGLP